MEAGCIFLIFRTSKLSSSLLAGFAYHQKQLTLQARTSLRYTLQLNRLLSYFIFQ
jgi:hypothetical protein